MAKLPPKKPPQGTPVLPGLSGVAPTRPFPGIAQPPAPSTSTLVKDTAVKIAKRVANSSKHVVVLEMHTVSMMQLLATIPEAAQILKAAGYNDIYFEADARMQRASTANAVFPRLLKRLATPPKSGAAKDPALVQAALINAFTQAVQSVFQTTTPLPVHAVGDEYICAEEALNETRAHFGRNPLLVEQTYIAGVKKLRDDTFAKNPNSTAVPKWDALLQTASGHSFPDALMDMLKMVSYMPVDGAEKTKFIASMARELSASTANPRHVEELTMLFEHLDHYRTNGASDAAFAKNGLAHAKGANTLFVAGAEHGWLSNPASLPSQIAQQAGIAEKDVQVILPVQKVQALAFHTMLVERKLAGTLRDDLVIFDVESEKDYPVTQWLEKAHSIYAGQNIPVFAPSPKI